MAGQIQKWSGLSCTGTAFDGIIPGFCEQDVIQPMTTLAPSALDVPEDKEYSWEGGGDSLEAPIYPTLDKVPGVVDFASAAIFAAKAKQVDDGLYAGVEQLLQEVRRPARRYRASHGLRGGSRVCGPPAGSEEGGNRIVPAEHAFLRCGLLERPADAMVTPS